MDLASLEHFVFIPESTDSCKGNVYLLEPSEKYTSPAFVLIPYKNPRKGKPAPEYYSVKEKIPFELQPSHAEQTPLFFQAVTSKEAYIQHVKGLKEQIQMGNIYELNYCIRFFCEQAHMDPLQVFINLHKLAKAPYAMLFKTGDEFIISASPELFLRKEGNHLSTKPIKGTARRGKTKEEDHALKDALQHSLKERTENVMAVDVARNDLSMLATRGSVLVNKLYNIESFETVHQMVSTVSCELKPDASFETVIAATFPMASMTGAPKQSAMDHIDRFEDFERGNYSGAMGLIDEKDDYTLSVIIRSIFYNQVTKKLSVSAGGAITYLSEPEQEYEECLLKIKGLLNAMNASL